MKKILILSYHFPPMNAIASQRAFGYASYLKKFGYEPTILTFDWSKDDEDQFCSKDEFDSRIIFEEFENYKVIRIPVLNNRFLKILDNKQGIFIHKIWVLWSWLTGRLDARPIVEAFARSERYYLRKHLKAEDYELVVGIFSPHYHLRNAYLLSKRIGIPYVLDFRDLWDNKITEVDYSPSLSLKIRDWFVEKYWKKFGSNASYLGIIGEVWVEKLRLVTGNAKVESIFNGFKNDINTKLKTINDSLFRISYTGTLYDWQDYKMMIDGLSLFLNNCSKHELGKISVEFVGTIKKGDFDAVLDYIESNLKKYNVNVSERVSKEETISKQRNSEVLLFATPPKVKGFYSGKIFEYISSGSMILVGPQDFKGAADLVKETNTGAVYNSKDELSKMLMGLFIRWKNGEVIKPKDPVVEKIEFFSRENQAKLFSKILDKSLE